MKVSIASTWRKLITIAARPAPLAYKPKVAARGERVSKGEGVGRVNTPGVFFSICFGLLAIFGVVIALLFLQVKEMKVEMVHWKQRLAAAEVHLGEIEKIAQQQIASPRHMPITLGNDDMKAIRAFIKVLPSKPGAQQKIHVGEEIWGTRSVPVPESLINQIPKLRGARFLVDDNGAIIIIGQGSNRADAVIEPQ
jgi:hypothetical protein